MQTCDALLPQALADLQESMAEAIIKVEEVNHSDAAELRPDERDNSHLQVSTAPPECEGRVSNAEASQAEATCKEGEEDANGAEAAATGSHIQAAEGAEENYMHLPE